MKGKKEKKKEYWIRHRQDFLPFYVDVIQEIKQRRVTRLFKSVNVNETRKKVKKKDRIEYDELIFLSIFFLCVCVNLIQEIKQGSDKLILSVSVNEIRKCR